MTEQTLTPIYVPMEKANGILEKARTAHEKYLIKQQESDLETAIEYYVEAIKSSPASSEAYYRLASLLLIKGQISSGSTVIANPVLVGTETELTGLQIDNTKYKISGGGGGGSTYYQEKVLCDVTSKQELYDLIDNSNEMFKSFLSTVPGEGSYNLYDNLMTRTGFYVKFKSSATFVNEEDESDTLTLSDIGLSNAEIRGYCGFHELCNYWDTYFSGLAYDGGIRINICAYVDNQYIGELYLSMSVTEVVEEVEESTYTISFDTVELETNSGEKRYALIAEDNTDWFDVIDELVVFM